MSVSPDTQSTASSIAVTVTVGPVCTLELIEKVELAGSSGFCFGDFTLRRNRRKCTRARLSFERHTGTVGERILDFDCCDTVMVRELGGRLGGFTGVGMGGCDP